MSKGMNYSTSVWVYLHSLLLSPFDSELLTPDHNPKPHYLPIGQKFTCHKLCNDKESQKSQNLAPFEMSALYLG